jgi:hypothetical protein
MNIYIKDTKFAIIELIKLISIEEAELKKLMDDHQKAKAELERRYFEFQASEACIDDNMTDIHLQKAYGQFYTYGLDVVKPLEQNIMQLKLSLAAKDTSIRALCGALLQIAKQGISTVHNVLANCPDGRDIGSEKLKNVIWQSRNQSMHYEESTTRPYHQPVIDCFNSLQSDFGSVFNLANINLAKEIIDLLGWKDYSKYEQDMISMLG